MWLIMKTLLLTPFSDVWAARCIFLRLFSFLNILCAQRLHCTAHRPQAANSWFLGNRAAAADAEHGCAGLRRLPRAPAAQRNPVPRWSALLGPAGAPRHANWKTLRKSEWCFSPETSCFSERRCQGACLGEYLQKWNAKVVQMQPNWIHLQM